MELSGNGIGAYKKEWNVNRLVISAEEVFWEKVLTKEPFCCIFAAGNRKEE